MASINEKLNYINETKSLIKDKLNILGSEIEDETTFREYAEKIEDLYEEWPKTSDTNIDILLNNTKKAKMNMILKGNLEQKTTPSLNDPCPINVVKYGSILKIVGRNLFKNEWEGTKVAGIDTTLNEDGSLTFDGTNSNYSITKAFGQVTLTPGNYTISTHQTGTIDGSVWIQGMDDNTDMFHYNFNTVSSKTITVSSTTTFIIRLYTAKGRTFDNFTFSLMIEKGDVVNNYEKYKEQTFPIDLGVKNYINKNNINTTTTANWNISIQDETVIITHKNTYDTGTPTYNLGVLPEGNYIFSCITDALSIGLYKDDTYLQNLLQTSTFSSDGTNSFYIQFGNTAASSLTYTNLQVEAGTIIHPYTKYDDELLECCKIENAQDYFYKANDKWYKKQWIDKIDSYNGETIETSYISTTGGLDIGATVYYELTEPNDIEIINPILIQELENISQAFSYDNQTNIIQESMDLPFIITASTLKKNSN